MLPTSTISGVSLDYVPSAAVMARALAGRDALLVGDGPVLNTHGVPIGSMLPHVAMTAAPGTAAEPRPVDDAELLMPYKPPSAAAAMPAVPPALQDLMPPADV